MGTGIGKECKRCDKQLNYDDGFSYNEKFCKSCERTIEFDLLSPVEKQKLLESEIKED